MSELDQVELKMGNPAEASANLVARMITRCAENWQMRIQLNGAEVTPREAFLDGDGVEAISGYASHIHNEIYGVPMEEGGRVPALSEILLLMTDGLEHARENFKAPSGAIDLDAFKQQYGINNVFINKKGMQ